MGSINKQISRFETTAVYTHPDAKVDVVLVHGLNGEPQRTWTAKNGVFWPTDLLPESLRTTRANILVYGYNADVYSKKHGVDPSDNFLFMHAQSLVTSLTHYRKDEQSSRNPIIWVCHSLGGLLVKRALLYSNDLRASQHEDYRQIYVSTFGLIFLGTPHAGSDMSAWGVMLQAMSDAVVPKAFWQSESVLLKTLKKDNETLLNINNHFLDIYQRFKILMAHENHKTDLKGTKMLVVDAQSASPQLPGVTYFAIEATHSGMCKFESKNAPGYRTVAVTIKEWAEEAPDVIATRWRVEEDEKMARAKHEIEERMKPWLKSQQAVQEAGHAQSRLSRIESPAPELSTQSGGARQMLRGSSSSGISLPFEVEEIFEIQDPDNLNHSLQSLRPPSKLGSESKPLLIEAAEFKGEAEPPSQASTVEATGFVFVKPTVFKPNTIFKGREKEMKELHKTLMDKSTRAYGTSSVLVQSMPGGGKTHMARQYVFEHKTSYPGGIFWIRCKSLQELEYGYWDIGKAVAPKEMEWLSESGRNETEKVVKLVQTWLSTHEDWLLVLDGIHFDYPGLENFIPLNRNTSIIYTSTEKTTPEAYQFDNPQIMVLDPLSAREAQELLLEEMGKKKPWNADDLSRAKELVELMERLPVMIHVAALHLKATREPLSKYLRSFRSRPKAGNLPAYRAVREQLQSRGNIAALNLMSLLSFFSQHIPVEMLALGLKALDKRTPVKSQDPETRKATLNNTLKLLIAFALVERNENDEMPSVSGQSSRSVDMAQDTLDILRIHGIVQAFFVDTLADEKQAAFWLDRAICVYCRAFDESDRRIRDDPTTGLPEDYLRFSIHGKRLASFLDRFERKYPELELCREALVARLDGIDHRIEQLTKRKRSGDEGDGEGGVISVFERTNSLSEVDSATPPSNSSINDWRMWDESTAPLESPALYSPSDYNPYHWHVTYPYDIVNPDMPIANAEDNLSGTVTPQPAPVDIMDAIPDEFEPVHSPIPSHRTIRRHSWRRYHDQAGSWRASPQVLSDPRVSISRETVKGFISHPNTHGQNESRSSGENKVTGSSDAESTLNSITKTNPPPPQGTGFVEDMVGVSGTEAPESPTQLAVARPKLIAGRPSYTGTAHTETSPASDQPVPTFSQVMGTYPPPSSKYAAATIMRLKDSAGPVATDGLAPVKVSSPLAAVPLSTSSPHASPPTSQAAVPEDAVAPSLTARVQPASAMPNFSTEPSSSPVKAPSQAPAAPVATHSSSSIRSAPAKGTVTDTPSSIASPDRSVRSSPPHADGPHRPPPIPIEINTSSALRSSPASIPSTIRHWDTYRLSDPEYTLIRPAGYEALAHSLPTTRSHAPNPPYPLTIPLHPNGRPAASLHPWTALSPDSPNPQGYSSQPMSRNASHQGGSISAGSSALPPSLPPRQPQRPVSATPTPTSRRGTYQLFARSTSPSPAPFQRIRRASRSRSRRPSVVETEPSPSLGTAGFDIGTPPTRYSLHPGGGARRRRTDSIGGTSAEGPAGSHDHPSGSSSPSSEQRAHFWNRLGGSKRGRSNTPGHDASSSRRAESAGSRLVGLGRRSFRHRSPAASPELFPAEAAASHGGADATPRTAAAESMSPSGSAGIRLADGTVVEFGATPPGGGSSGGGGLGLGITE